MSAGYFRAAENLSKDDGSAQVGSKPAAISSELLRGMPVTLEARLGQATMTVDDLMALKPGAVVTLDNSLVDHLDLYLNGVLVARGVVVAVGDKFGVRIMEVGSTS